jgi:hypothetical protein
MAAHRAAATTTLPLAHWVGWDWGVKTKEKILFFVSLCLCGENFFRYSFTGAV